MPKAKIRGGSIILLNGSSSSGKTTLALALQQALQEPYQHIALDQFRDGMPGRFRGLNSPCGTPGAEGLNIVPTLLNDQMVSEIRFGKMGKDMLKAMRRAIRAFALAGQNIIIDDLMFEKDFLMDYLEVLQGLSVFFVGVRCSLEEVNLRESSRSGRFPGTASSHFDKIHEFAIYDLEVNTEKSSPHECATLILDKLNNPVSPTAFEQLAKQLQDA